MTAIDHAYFYSSPSIVEPARDGTGGVSLRLSTSGGAADHPRFFDGRVLQPRVVADHLQVLMDVVHARYHMPAAMLQRILLLADPVVTACDGRLRFEGFSACSGVYARLDLLDGALEGDTRGRGTTNVDFNAPMLAALARVRESDALHLAVGVDGVETTTSRDRVVERRVPLPVRWIRGFGEVQACQARMELVHDVPANHMRHFLRAIPKAGMQRRTTWVARSGAGLRLSYVEDPVGVRVGGLHRLRVLDKVVQHAERCRIYRDATTGASAWELTSGTMRFVLVLSPEVWRGFSGEGQLLRELARDDRERFLTRLRAALTWHWLLDEQSIAASLDAPLSQVRSALTVLASRGLVGYDLSAAQFFHRALPFDLSRVESLQPRLKAARALVEAGAVSLERRGDPALATVRSGDAEHRVQYGADEYSCTCPWYAKHQQSRGPCKHVLAAQLVCEQADDE